MVIEGGECKVGGDSVKKLELGCRNSITIDVNDILNSRVHQKEGGVSL